MLKKRIPAAILMLSILVTGSYAANSYKKSIEVDYNINLSINGEKPKLTDINGKEVLPFIYEGTTYVPIRAVSELFGAEISYSSSYGQNNVLIQRYRQITADDIEVLSIIHEFEELGDRYYALKNKYDELMAASKLETEEIQRAIELQEWISRDAKWGKEKIAKLEENSNYLDELYIPFPQMIEDLDICISSSEELGKLIKSGKKNSEEAKKQRLLLNKYSAILMGYNLSYDFYVTALQCAIE